MRPLAPERAWEYLLTILARRAYTTEELRRKLLRRGIEAEQAEPLLARLQEYRIIDDAQYAEQYVGTRKRQRGKHALRQALRRKGIDEALVDLQLDSLDPSQQVAAATGLLTRFAWRYRPRLERASPGGTDTIEDQPTPQGRSNGTSQAAGDQAEVRDADELRREAEANVRRLRARAFAFLARRGFGSEAAAAALERVGWFDDLR